jgi:putative ABC transport system permease protein
MKLRDTIHTAFKGITVNGTRSLLTMLGIIIGVGAVVLMVSVGNSFQNYILTQIASVGTNTMEVMPSGLQKFGGNLQGITFDDFTAIQKLPNVESITPIIIVAKPVHYGKEDGSPLIFGSYDVMIDNYGLKLDHGRLLDQNDQDGAKNNAVIAHKTAEDLFGDADPVGSKVIVGETAFTIVGELQKVQSALLASLDTPIFIPFSTAKAMTGQTYLTYISLKTTGDAAAVKDDITTLMRQRHHIDNPDNDPDKDDFKVQSAEQVSSIVGSVTLGLTIFLSLVAGISLLVGGIGIMNIMLVSVTERTREIGLRKAVGARRTDILLQFLLEAIFLTLSGGAIGILGGVFFGWLLCALAAKFLGSFTFILSFTAVFLAVFMALFTGLVFGLYPARRAANLSPMEALRYE